jgi:hypothetical protein
LFLPDDGQLLAVTFCDGYEIRKFCKDKNDRCQIPIYIKFIGKGREVEDTVKSVFVLGSIDGVETNEYLQILSEHVFKKLAGRVDLGIINGKNCTLELIDVSDMSFRCKAYQNSSPSGTYVNPAMIVHKDMVGDILWPRATVF